MSNSSLVYLTAQKDDLQFLWQLELQLYNFQKIGIPSRDIQVLIGYEPKRGLRYQFREFIAKNRHVGNYFIYPDQRASSAYDASIQPHLLQQHLVKYPELTNASIFYHEAGIILKGPLHTDLFGNACCHIPPARHRIDPDLLENSGLLEHICREIDVSYALEKEMNIIPLNAPLIVRQTSPEFWGKVEEDSEKIHSVVCSYGGDHTETALFGERCLPPNLLKKLMGSYPMSISLSLNARRFSMAIQSEPELDFCLASDPIDRWADPEIKILLMTADNATNSDKLFDKNKFSIHAPYYDRSLRQISNETCSYPIGMLIAEFTDHLRLERIPLKDMSFLIPARIDSPDRLENIFSVVNYLDKFFDTNILILEADSTSHILRSDLPVSCKLVFVEDHNPLFNHTKYNNQLALLAESPFISIYDSDVILPVKQIMTAMAMLRSGQTEFVSPYNGHFLWTDYLFKNLFSKVLEPDLLTYNRDKFHTIRKDSWGGASFINKWTYMEAGMSNEYFESWGPEDGEIAIRFQILGYNVQRVEGAIYHLPHKRGGNSSYSNDDLKIKYRYEYHKICNMKKEELRAYIDTWKWRMRKEC